MSDGGSSVHLLIIALQTVHFYLEPFLLWGHCMF